MDVPLYDSLDSQVVLVTGATRGIGKAIADGLVDLDATVYAGARDTDDIEATDRHAIELDVTDDDGMVAAVDRIEREQGRLDVLVNNAGVMDSREPLDGMPTDVIDHTLDTNLRGAVLMTKYALPLLLAEAGGRIVAMSSGLGAITESQSGGTPAYRISKTGVNGLTKYLDGEYAADGLIANSVCPGYVQTDMTEGSAPRTPEKGAETPVWLARFQPDAPSGRFWRDKAEIEW
ncbi:3-oxoacyl-[acyl-carrier protein] reductase [Haloarcula marismortui ATCC 43049]|uniref:3-oxoacyl-[acyl-carrier protein] reductase n=1 Tax=Haloarcula marismortui (strain ATCC 43049 / DSM 3752 / JCM 8966 / VKM B-1809) TaxID=272569 RepID=Q5UX46_HALMA|nr:SDR family NAD(P)-dependent oxidoreductase [Haloarcula marismortui]AAV48157.1 3-oxoacyl-[acyl-carrier protein] reductase [Haloarcula marismortui ATCC 43049]QCP92822.1 SDR family NAD(P)-dependent oxidoreductase [Haloarcula marismortui ATCC 43049]